MREGAMKKLIEQIAKDHLHIDNLETQNLDRLDFHEVAVWNIRAALEAAYNAGRTSGKTDK
jgi:hypothetical protein